MQTPRIRLSSLSHHIVLSATLVLVVCIGFMTWYGIHYQEGAQQQHFWIAADLVCGLGLIFFTTWLLRQINPLLQTLTEREALLRSLFDTASVGIFLVGTDSRITQVNQGMAELFGCSMQQLLGMEYAELVEPSQREAGRVHKQQLLEAKVDLVDTDRLYLRADGTPFWGRLTGRRMYGPNGELRGLLGAITDISDRKRLQHFESFRSQTLEMMARDEPLDDILQRIVLGVEDISPGAVVSCTQLTPDGLALGHCVSPNVPKFYTDAINGVPIGPTHGSCGAAAALAQRVVVESIATHPNWAPFKELAAKAGFGACWSQPIMGSDGRVLGTLAMYHSEPNTPSDADFTIMELSARLATVAIERHRAAQKLRESEVRLQLAASVFTHAQEGIMITAPDGTILEVNTAFSNITGYSRDEVVGVIPHMMTTAHPNPDYYSDMLAQLAAEGRWQGEHWIRHKCGKLIALNETISAVYDSSGQLQHYVALLSDITALMEQQKKLEHNAHFDTLTDLPNRLLLMDRLNLAMNQSQRRGQSLALVFVDLDGFKSVNDQHGHAVGDELLRAIALRMRTVLRDSDTLARFGGDEFVVILVDLFEPQACIPMLQRLLDTASQPVELGPQQLQVSASLGVALYTPDSTGIDADALLRLADQAMYRAKLAGKNRYHLPWTGSTDAVGASSDS